MNKKTKKSLVILKAYDRAFDYDLKDGNGYYQHRNCFEFLPMGEDITTYTMVEIATGEFEWLPHYVLETSDPPDILKTKREVNGFWQGRKDIISREPNSYIVIPQSRYFMPTDKAYPHFMEFVAYLNERGLDLPEEYKQEILEREEIEKEDWGKIEDKDRID